MRSSLRHATVPRSSALATTSRRAHDVLAGLSRRQEALDARRRLPERPRSVRAAPSSVATGRRRDGVDFLPSRARCGHPSWSRRPPDAKRAPHSHRGDGRTPAGRVSVHITATRARHTVESSELPGRLALHASDVSLQWSDGVIQRVLRDDIHPSQRRCVTAAEVADLIRVPKSTVEDWARRGVIPSRKVGRRRLYLREKIEELLRADDP